MLRSLIIVLFLSVAVPQESDTTAYVRYFNTDHDFKAGMSITAAERNKSGYIQVDYNEEGKPIRKQWITSGEKVLNEVLLYYNDSDQLEKQAWVNESGNTWQIEFYGEQEPWSREFRLAAFPSKDRLFFDAQKTRFFLNGGEQVEKIEFFTITGEKYGTIRLEYDYRGLLVSETWMLMPGSLIFRKFVYEVNLLTGTRKIWEYGKNDSLISSASLEMAAEDKLYLTPPPRTGNTLDEADEILGDIKRTVVSPDIPALIPKMENDMLYLLSGEVYQVEIIALDRTEFRFRLQGNEDILSIPLTRVQKIMSKWGNLVYPD